MVGHAQVQKSAAHYTDAARDEITLLSQIREGDPADERACVRLLDSFEHSGPHGRHVCMVFEVCAVPLFPVLPGHMPLQPSAAGAPEVVVLCPGHGSTSCLGVNPRYPNIICCPPLLPACCDAPHGLLVSSPFQAHPLQDVWAGMAPLCRQ